MKQFLRYFVVGALAAVVDIGLFIALTTFVGIGYVPANTVAVGAGMVLNYCLSSIWVFQQKTMNIRRDFIPFALIGIAGLGIQCLLLYGLIDQGFAFSFAGLFSTLSGITLADELLLSASKVFVVGTTFLWNFFVRKYVVFERSDKKTATFNAELCETNRPNHSPAKQIGPSFEEDGTIALKVFPVTRKDSEMKNVVIMGAGPAGLAAGYELAKNGLTPVLFESDTQVGGISKTIRYKDNYFDLGGHRFFTKLDDVNDLWQEVLGDQFKKTPRMSRIYYNNKFFNYPLTAMNALLGVGFLDTGRILLSYMAAKIKPSETENTFEEWVSNRFGKRLFSIFFKTYTEKVWGIPCSEIQAEWAAQRIKGLSLYTAVVNALFKPKNSNIKTLIDQFDYPEFGPGMMYTAMEDRIKNMGGSITKKSRVVKVNHDGNRVLSVEFENETGKTMKQHGSDFLSSIPLTELVQILSPTPPKEVLDASNRLKYRSLITVDITVDQENLFPDNWIYIHSPEVKLGRIQNFKNWSPSMVADSKKTTLGLEYFCNENDEFWNMDDKDLFELAASEVSKIKICERSKIEDGLVVRVPKAYPVYDMEYPKHLETIRSYLAGFENLQPIGRYGMFKYNNMDHSILTGLYASRNILAGETLFDIWNVNTDEEYHEEKHQSESEGIVKYPQRSEKSTPAEKAA